MTLHTGILCAVDRVAVAQHSTLRGAEVGEPSSGSALVQLQERGAADEVRAVFQRDRKAQTRLVGVRGLVDILAVQRERRLQPQGVSRAQTGRQSATRRQRIPERAGDVARSDAFGPLLARVAGPGDQHGRPSPGQLDALPGRQLRIGVAEHVDEERSRAWPLHGEQHRLVADILDLHVGSCAGGVQPREVGGCVRRVVDDEPALVGEAVDEDIVGDAAVRLAVQRVVRVPRGDRRDIERRNRAQPRGRARPPKPDPAEVRDIEDTHPAAHRLMLRDDAGVLERHLPARERHETGPERLVSIAQGKLSQ